MVFCALKVIFLLLFPLALCGVDPVSCVWRLIPGSIWARLETGVNSARILGAFFIQPVEQRRFQFLILR